MVKQKRSAFRSRIRRLKSKILRKWRNLRNDLYPRRDVIETYFDEQLAFLTDAKDIQDGFFYDPSPPLESDEEIDELLRTDISKLRDDLAKWSPLILYKSSKRLERLTTWLIWFTIMLAIFTVVSVLLAVHTVFHFL